MDAQYRLIGNRYLKLSIRRPVRTAKRVGRILWHVRALFGNGAQGWESEIPSRITLFAEAELK